MLKSSSSQRIVSGPKGLQLAVTALKEGELVAFSTETVYGLGADATNDEAVAKIFSTKGRPLFNPLIIHVPTEDHAKSLVAWNDVVAKLADTFWPGALTMVLPRLPSCKVSYLASAGLDCLAVRAPSHDLAQRLLQLTDLPIAAPSANKFGYISPTTAVHVDKEFGSELSYILDGGPCQVGLESTVIDLTTKQPEILRPGGIALEELNDLIGPFAAAEPTSELKSPGMLKRHYAPKASLRLDVNIPLEGEVLIGFGPTAPQNAINLSPTGDLLEAATKFFATMRKLDNGGNQRIAVMPIPKTGLGVAINDRLNRAATV